MKFNKLHLVSAGIVILILIIIISLLAAPFYRKVLKPNKDKLPGPLAAWIEKRDSRQSVSPIVYKPEETIKILEGWTLENIGAYLDSFPAWDREDFDKIAGRRMIDYRQEAQEKQLPDFSERFSFLEDKPAHYGLEGFLFPDTYRVFADATLEEVVVKMLENFDRKLTAEMRAEIAKQGKSIYEIIIMASLIEKEAPINYRDAENRDARLVSGIFWNRLRIGQALQADATLSYLFNNNKPAHSGAELTVDSPYNSYKYRGLPPTPICNPGLKAIGAAIYPLKTDYFYFLTTLDGAAIYYAETYQEHLQNKYKYLK